MRKLRVGHAGCGSVSIRGILPHITQPDAQEQLELVAVCDVDGDRARAVAEQFGAARHYDSFEEMVAADDLDLIILATPIMLHAAQAELAMRSGKHVYVNKAMATTLDEADRVLQASKETGMKLVAAPGQMLAPSLIRIRDMVRNGDFGQMYWGIANNSGGGHGIENYKAGGTAIRRDPTWYYKKPGGGTMYDLAVYSLHSLTGILGTAKSVTAVSGIVRKERQFDDLIIDVEADDNTWLLVEFESNCYVTVGAAFSHGGPHMFWGQLSLYGSEGGIEVTSIHHNSGWPYGIRTIRGNRIEELQIAHTEHPLLNAYHKDIEEPHLYVDIMHLADNVRGGSGVKPIASLEHGRHVVEIIDKGYQAARTGQRQLLTTTFE